MNLLSHSFHGSKMQHIVIRCFALALETLKLLDSFSFVALWRNYLFPISIRLLARLILMKCYYTASLLVVGRNCSLWLLTALRFQPGILLDGPNITSARTVPEFLQCPRSLFFFSGECWIPCRGSLLCQAHQGSRSNNLKF